MANGHGGARSGAGRKKKALSEKLVDGNPGKAPLTKIQFGMKDTGLAGEDMPPVAEYLTQVTKNSNQNLTPQIYADTWKWLYDRGCAHLVKKELINSMPCTLLAGYNARKALTSMVCWQSTLPKEEPLSKDLFAGVRGSADGALS